MVTKFKINIEEIERLRRYSEIGGADLHVDLIDPETKRKEIKPVLNRLVKGELNDHKVISGQRLQSYVFPTGEEGDYDIFISYSHDDKDEAVFLASWLEQQCHLNVFLDFYIWGSADALLREIDNLYCRKKDGLYDYPRRNYSTSHVHAMLSMAIMDIINKSECCIFIESGHSIHLEHLKKAKSAKTLSPWIYEENKMMQLLPNQGVRCTRYFSARQNRMVEDSLAHLMIAHKMDLHGFYPLTFDNLKRMKGQGQDGLDRLYQEVSGVCYLCD